MSHHFSRPSEMMWPLVGIISLITLAACADRPPEPVVKTVEVKVAVPVACVPQDMPAAPAYTDDEASLKAAPDFASRYQLLAANHAMRVSREQILEVIVNGCRKAAQ